MSFVPAHDVLGDSSQGPVAFVCHGILGSRRNWRSFARRLLPDLPGWSLVLVDHRNHGGSMGAPPPHTVEACAEDLEALARHLGRPPRVVVGHSFGGKVALALAARRPAGLEQVWSLDAIPAALDPDEAAETGPAQVLSALRSVPMPQANRRGVLEALEATGLEPAIAQWLGMNLRATDGGLVWSVDIDAAEAMIRDYLARDLWAPIESTDDAAPDAEIVRAGRSDRWTPDILRRLDALPAGAAGRRHDLPRAGHWVHVDDPDGLRALLLEHWAR